MSYDENRISDLIDGGLELQKQLSNAKAKKLNRFIIDDLRVYYRRKGYIVIQLNKHTFRPGFPELQILRGGKCTFIKILQEGQELTKEQCKSIEQIKSKGFDVLFMSEVPEPPYKRKGIKPNPLL